MEGYKESFIKDLNLNSPKITISGLIVSKEENYLMIDDNTGIVQVEIENDLNVNDYARVFGILMEFNGKKVLKGEIIQDLSKVNKKLYQKIRDLL